MKQFLQFFDWKNDHLRQFFGVCYGEITQLDKKDYPLFHYSLAYAEELHTNKFISSLIKEWFGLKHSWVLLRRLLYIINSKTTSKKAF